MLVNGVWNIESLGNMYVAEMENGELKMFPVAPFKELKESDLKDYKGHHPRKMKGIPMPEYLFKFYGLELNPDASDAVRVRVKVSLKNRYEEYCKVNDTDPSRDLREYMQKCVDGM